MTPARSRTQETAGDAGQSSLVIFACPRSATSRDVNPAFSRRRGHGSTLLVTSDSRYAAGQHSYGYSAIPELFKSKSSLYSTPNGSRGTSLRSGTADSSAGFRPCPARGAVGSAGLLAPTPAGGPLRGTVAGGRSRREVGSDAGRMVEVAGLLGSDAPRGMGGVGTTGEGEGATSGACPGNLCVRLGSRP